MSCIVIAVVEVHRDLDRKCLFSFDDRMLGCFEKVGSRPIGGSFERRRRIGNNVRSWREGPGRHLHLISGFPRSSGRYGHCHRNGCQGAW